MTSTWDCIVVGGGAAGLSAALAAYPTVEVREGDVRSGARHAGGFALELADGATETARHVLLATGADYRYPDLPGIAERWGRSVFHCPFCHGWEVRDRRLAVVGRDAMGAHRALLLRAWSDDVTLLTDGLAELKHEETEQLRSAGVTVDDRPLAGLHGPGDALTAIDFADGSELPCDGLLVPVTLHQRSDLATRLGAESAPSSPLAANAIAVGPRLETNVPRLFAAGDTTTQMPSLANAIATGSFAAAAIVDAGLG